MQSHMCHTQYTVDGIRLFYFSYRLQHFVVRVVIIDVRCYWYCTTR